MKNKACFYTAGNTPVEEKLMTDKDRHEDSGMMSESIRGRRIQSLNGEISLSCLIQHKIWEYTK